MDSFGMQSVPWFSALSEFENVYHGTDQTYKTMRFVSIDRYRAARCFVLSGGYVV